MSKEGTEHIIKNLVKDEEFRRSFMENRECTLQNMDLTEEEKEAFRNLDVNEFVNSLSKAGELLGVRSAAAIGCLYI